ncbi:MAG: efflux RND transporter periplasmic adaptor subunit [Gammaproteobacteria bacterium]|nr:efflux RND transporter periplasmic adaptor subunit [Gammaproteobacteria bacterium]
MIIPNKARTKITHLTFTSLLAGLLLVTACSDDASNQARKPRPHLVDVTQAQVMEISIQKTLPATLEPLRTVQIFNQEIGLLASMPFYEGDTVSKDSVLATLDDALLGADLNKAQATLKQAQLNLKRLISLVPRKLASEDEIAKAKTAVEIARAELSQQQTRFNHATIRAPFAGIISQRLVEPGDVIPVHKHMLSLIDTSSLKARMHVSELLLPLINLNDPVKVKIDALGDQQFDAQVIRIHPTIDAISRRGIIEVELTPVPDGALPGQLCRINFSTEKHNRLMIPFAAVRHENQGSYVFVVMDNKVKRVDVTTGLQNGESIEVLDTIKAGDTLVINGFFGLEDNKAVVTNQDVPQQ